MMELASNSVGLGADPVKIVFVPGETCGVSDLTSSGGSEGDNSDLLPLLSSGSVLVLDLELHVKRTTRVSVAGSLSSGGVNADNTVSDNTVDGVTLGVRDDGPVLDHPEDGGDSSGRVTGLTPSSAGHHLVDISGVSSHGHAAGPDVVVEGDGAGQLDEGNVVGKSVGVPLWVSPAVVRSDLHPVGLAGGPHVVSSGHDVEVGGTVSAMGSGHDVVLRDEGTTAEPGVVDEEGHLPGPLVLLSLESSDNPLLGGRSLNTTLGGKVNIAGLVGGLALGALLDGPGQLDELVLSRAGLGIDQSVAGGELGDVAGSGGPPVLLWPQTATIGQGQGGATKQN